MNLYGCIHFMNKVSPLTTFVDFDNKRFTSSSLSCFSLFLQFHLFIHAYYPSCQLASRAATKLLHPCLSLASLWMVAQLWFVFLSSASTVLPQFVFGQPLFRFPSLVQGIATLVIELASLRSTKCISLLVMELASLRSTKCISLSHI